MNRLHVKVIAPAADPNEEKRIQELIDSGQPS